MRKLLHADKLGFYNRLWFGLLYGSDAPNNPCRDNNGGCSELCLFNGTAPVCQCSHGRKVNETHCVGNWLSSLWLDDLYHITYFLYSLQCRNHLINHSPRVRRHRWLNLTTCFDSTIFSRKWVYFVIQVLLQRAADRCRLESPKFHNANIPRLLYFTSTKLVVNYNTTHVVHRHIHTFTRTHYMQRSSMSYMHSLYRVKIELHCVDR